MNELSAAIIAAALLAPCQGGPVNEEPPATEPRSLGAETSKDAAAIAKIGTSLRKAGRGLAEGRTDDATRAAQRTAIEEIEKLISAGKSVPPPDDTPQPSPADAPRPHSEGAPSPKESAPGEESSGSSSEGQPMSRPGRNRSGRAEESSDRAADSRRSSDPVPGYRPGVIQEAWGHLPPRLRDQLLNAGSDKYLPRYDSLVRSYFESLARPADEGGRRRGEGETRE